jgi:malate synthase
MIGEDILQKFPGLFGTKKVNGRELDVEQTIATLTREPSPSLSPKLRAG